MTKNPIANLHIGHEATQFGRAKGAGECSGCGRPVDHGGGDVRQAARAESQTHATTEAPGPFAKDASLKGAAPGRVAEANTCKVCGRPSGSTTPLRDGQAPPGHGAPGALSAKSRQRAARGASQKAMLTSELRRKTVTAAKGKPKVAKSDAGDTTRAKPNPDEAHSKGVKKIKGAPPSTSTS